MRTLNFETNPNSIEISNLVREKRIYLQKKDKVNKKKYTAKAIAKAIGCSSAHYQRLENGEKDFYNIKWIYGVSKELEIPLDKLIGIYLNLSEEELKKNFTILLGDNYPHNNSLLIKESRKHLESKVLQVEIAEIAKCSKTHITKIESSNRLVKNIQLLYVFAHKLNIPLWVLIRNELNLENEDMQNVISYSPKNSIKKMRQESIDKILQFSEDELNIAHTFLFNLKI